MKESHLSVWLYFCDFVPDFDVCRNICVLFQIEHFVYASCLQECFKRIKIFIWNIFELLKNWKLVRFQMNMSSMLSNKEANQFRCQNPTFFFSPIWMGKGRCKTHTKSMSSSFGSWSVNCSGLEKEGGKQYL